MILKFSNIKGKICTPLTPSLCISLDEFQFVIIPFLSVKLELVLVDGDSESNEGNLFEVKSLVHPTSFLFT